MLPTLYREQRQWRIWVEESGNKVYLCTEYGTVGGKLVQAKREITECGREDSLVEKGHQQANKKWEDKKNRENYTETQNDGPVTKKHKTEEAVLPMLADKVAIKDNGLKNMPLPCHAQPKLDGFRCVTHVHRGKMTSRTNKNFLGLAGLRNALCSTLKERLSEGVFGSGDFYLDGELFVEGGDFNKLSSVIKPAQHHDDYDPPEINYHIYDCFDLHHMDTPFSKRIETLRSILGDLSDRIHCVPTGIVNNVEEMHREMQLCLEMGHEGLMLRNSSSPYVLRKRSKHLQKFKEFHDAEFRIVGYKEGKGIDAGTIIFECVVDDNVFSVRPKGTLKHRKDMFENGDSFVGKMLTVTYQELSEKGVPRFPVGKIIRPDFDYKH